MTHERPPTNPRKAWLYAGVTVLMWSTVATAFKLALRHLTPLGLVLWASVVSTGVLTVVCAARGELGRVFPVPRGAALRTIGLGLLNPVVYYLVLFAAYDRLPAQEAQPLNYTWAITLSLLSVPLLGHRPTVNDWLGLVLAYGGAVVIATRGELAAFRLSDPLGVGLALGSTVVWSLYWLWNARSSDPPVVALLRQFVVGTTVAALTAAALGRLELPSPAGFAGAAWVGVFEMGFAFVLWLAALRHATNAARVSALVFLSPFLSLVFIHAFVGETIRDTTILGLALIVAGLVVQRFGPCRR